MGELFLLNKVEPSQALDGFSGKPDELITLLQFFQINYGFISEESVLQIARFLRVSEAHVFGVASFYSQFRFEKPGKNRIRVCLGCCAQAPVVDIIGTASCGRAAGTMNVLQLIQQTLAENHLKVRIVQVGNIGPC